MIDTAITIGNNLSPPARPPIWAEEPPRWKLSLSLKPADLAFDSAHLQLDPVSRQPSRHKSSHW